VPRFLLFLLFLSSALTTRAQPKTPADFGYRHFPMRYQRDTVHILVLSRRGDEQKRKPVLFFAQGSTPSPVVLYDEQGPYRLLPIKMDSLLAGYHLVVVAKPGLPLVGDLRKLGPGGYVGDLKTGLLPAKYCQHNYLEYYVQRNNAVLRYLSQQPWVQADDITAMGHSEGSSIVARMARHPRHLRRVIYLAGSPLGRIITQVSSARLDSDSVGAETLFSRWHSRLPIFVGYGTRDRSALLNDYLRVEATRRHRTNFSFHAYPEVEHNFFGFTNGQIDYEKGQWDRVARDFLQWMRAH
jgi:dienelactone hydrolase